MIADAYLNETPDYSLVREFGARMSKDIAVAVNVYNEPIRQVEACFERICAHLPGASVAVFCNGLRREEIFTLAKYYRYSLTLGENLATNSTWNLWWKRMLEFFHQSGAEICFKFDPDTMVDANPKDFPSSDYFGTVWLSKRYRIPFIQGGITGLSRRAVDSLSQSGLLDLSNSTAVPFSQYQWDGFGDDQHLAMALAFLKIFPSEWEECKSMWKTQVLNKPIRYAIVHPRFYGRHSR
jgi:hypothetical protein